MKRLIIISLIIICTGCFNYNELNDYCEKEMPNKFSEVMSKIKSFLRSVKERVFDRER